MSTVAQRGRGVKTSKGANHSTFEPTGRKGKVRPKAPAQRKTATLARVKRTSYGVKGFALFCTLLKLYCSIHEEPRAYPTRVSGWRKTA